MYPPVSGHAFHCYLNHEGAFVRETGMSLMQKLFGFQGRLSRGDYWLIVLSVLILDAVVMALYPRPYLPPALMSEQDPLTRASAAAAVFKANGINVILGLLLFWPSLAASVKRLHDRNRSGLWLIAFWGPAILSGVFGVVIRELWLVWVYGPASPFYIWPQGPFLTAFTVALVLWLWGAVELGVLPGTAGSNKYGPAPQPAAGAEAAA
jgi:uncharacterized membrane protein YhaH (DUF805 family)